MIECHCATDTPDPPSPKHTHIHTITSQRPDKFIPTPPGHYTAVSGSHLQRHHSCGGRAPSHRPTHHISGLLIQFCKGNERKASCAFGRGRRGLLLSLWDLSNVIKIHAGALHILPVEPTGRSASKQALPSLRLVPVDGGATPGWAVRGNVLPVGLSAPLQCLIGSCPRDDVRSVLRPHLHFMWLQLIGQLLNS